MNLHFQDLIPQDYSDHSRVWIYQSNRQFTIDEALQINELLENFTATWKSHGVDVKGFGKLLLDPKEGFDKLLFDPYVGDAADDTKAFEATPSPYSGFGVNLIGW